MDIRVGQTVAVEIAAVPDSAAAEKTLVRLCRKDPAVRRKQRWQKRHRPSLQMWQRGGRMWRHRMQTRPPVQLAVGQKYQMLVTLDVMRDLESLGDCVKVGPAQ